MKFDSDLFGVGNAGICDDGECNDNENCESCPGDCGECLYYENGQKSPYTTKTHKYCGTKKNIKPSGEACTKDDCNDNEEWKDDKCVTLHPRDCKTIGGHEYHDVVCGTNMECSGGDCKEKQSDEGRTKGYWCGISGVFGDKAKGC